MDAFEAIFENTGEAKPAMQPVEQAPVEAPPPVEEATAAPAAEIVTETPPADAPAPEPQQDKGDKFVPLAAMLDERDKRKALEAKLAEFERQQQAQQPQADIPDPYDDPAGYNAHVAQMMQNNALAVKFDLSEEMALQAHGEEAVSAAKEWALSQDQAFKQQYIGARHPIDWVVRQHQQARDLELYKADPVAFARTILERSGQALASDATGGAVPSVGQQPPASRPVTPPRSIASAPSSGGGARDIAMGPLAAVDATFNR
jgi:hypothetical protein